MNACIDCLPCLARNAIDLARKSAQGDAALEARIAAEGMRILADAAATGYPLPPPCYARRLIDNALASCDGAVPDPWKPEKDKSTALAKRLLEVMVNSHRDTESQGICLAQSSPSPQRGECQKPALNTSGTNIDDNLRVPVPLCENNPSRTLRTSREEISSFARRLRLAIAGNVLDFSIYADLDIGEAMRSMGEAFEKPIDSAAVAALERAMDSARSILWIFDNCGEAVFDRLLIEPYREKVTLAVRGKPAFNDMTRAELAESGYPDGWAGGGVVSNDDGVPGVIDSTCGEAFRAAFAAADLVVAKGQANFETMGERTDKPIAFLFLAKCPVVCRRIGAEPRTIQILLRNFPL